MIMYTPAKTNAIESNLERFIKPVLNIMYILIKNRGKWSSR